MIRTPDGFINNCALANSDEEKNCLMCRGACPDRERFFESSKLVQGAHVAGISTQPETMGIPIGSRYPAILAKEENPDFEVFAPAVIPDEFVSHFLEQWLRAPSAGSIFYVILGDGQRYEIRMRKA